MKLDHFTRLEEGANSVYTLSNLASYVEKYIYLDGKPYRFGERYGFQRDIINDTARVTNSVKPAQIGLTTSTMAYILAGAASQPRFNAIYSLPTANDANKLVTTKLDPIIQGSPELNRLLDNNVNNSELKKLGNNFIFIRGSKSETAALSISADALIADEIDRSDPDTLKQFRSRLQASDLQIVKQFSTPTIEGVGISKEAETSVRYYHFATCNHCSHTFLPNYHEHIRIPGWSNGMEDINKSNLKDLHYQQAHWFCPHCGRDPELHPSRLQWVAENPTENYEANTYYITPVTACLVLRPSYLVRTSTEFNKRSEWKNQVLGETAEDANEQLVPSDINAVQTELDLNSSEIHFMGVDMGSVCAIHIGRWSMDTLLVVHRELVPLHEFEARRRTLIKEYKVVAHVYDMLPYTSEVMRITDQDPNAYAAIFTRDKGADMFILHDKKKDNDDSGKINIRRLHVNRTVLLDAIRDLFKERKLLIQKKNSGKEEFMNEQYLSLKRTEVLDKDDIVFIWQKTDGNDHSLFALGYLYLATRMLAKVGVGSQSASALRLVSSFRMREKT